MTTPGSWEEPLQRITAATCDPTWYYDKVVVLLRGLTGSGKSTFCDLLVRDLQVALDGHVNSQGRPRYIRVCSSSFFQDWREMRAMNDEQLLLDDFALSLQSADVVVVDERNIAQAEWQPFVDAVEQYNADPEKEGAIYAVLFSCRDEVHALQLNQRSAAPLGPEDLGRCYEAFATGADIGSRGVVTFDVDPDI